jgi:membrane-bound serine protease (ClpP class)
MRITISLFLLLCGAAVAISAGARNEVRLLDIHGAIGPAVADYVDRGLNDASKANDAAVILRLDTPGGLDASMRDIIRNILASDVPVIAWVAPNGARAASAGTYILYASHIAAMSPASNLGAATPVQIGGMPEAPKPGNAPQVDNKAKKSADDGNTMHRKMTNDAVAYIRGLADMRGRNADWAEKAVREAASLSATAAVKQHVVDLIAADIPALLKAVDGRTVDTAAGPRTLHTKDAQIIHAEPDWRSELLAVITDPNIAYLLMLLGFYGLFFEMMNPGFILPGVVGAICLLLAMFAFQVLPINYAGLGLILLGIAFMVAEVFVPSFGALGIGGLTAFVIGSIILLDTDAPGYSISLGLIAGLGLASALFFITVAGMVLKARRNPVISGPEEMIGLTGRAVDDFSDGHGHVHVHGEIWQAVAAQTVAKDMPVRVTAMHDLTLSIEPVSQSTSEEPPS